MTINLSEITFENDMYNIILPNNSILILNKIDESLRIDGYEDIDIKSINIEIDTAEGVAIKCKSVIGLNNDYFKIDTKYTQYEGAVLTSENMKYCTMEIYE